MAKNDPTIRFTEFSGVNNMDEPESLSPDELRAAVNVDITRRNKLRRRSGSTKKYSASDVVHSLYSNGLARYFVEGTTLKLLNEDYTTSALRTGMQRAMPVCYQDVGGEVYYSNGIVTGVIRNGTHQPWGIEPPGVPSLAAAVGGLYLGTYQVALTYATAEGRESGAVLAGTVELTAVGGIQIDGISTSSNPDVAYVNIYVSPPNGDILYFAAQVANGTSTANIVGGTHSVPLRTQHIKPPPAGHIIAYYKGRMLIAVGNILYFSEPYALDWFYLSRNFIPLPQKITLIAVVEDGFYVSSDKTYWHGGNDIKESVLITKSNTRAVQGTRALGDGQYVGQEGIAGEVQFWLNNNGNVCVGANSGQFQVIKKDKAQYPEATIGTGVFRRQNGLNQYLGLLLSNNNSSSAYLGDVATAEVIKNGVSE